MLLEAGEASFTAGDETLSALGPALLWLPSDACDGLTIAAGGSGAVLAINRDLLEQTIRQAAEAPELLGLLTAHHPLVLPIASERARAVGHLLALVAEELKAMRIGAQTYVGSALTMCFIEFWRHAGPNALLRSGGGDTSALLMRFRQLVEERFRDHWSVSQYAAVLGISPDRLHDTCLRILGRPPSVLVQQRVIHEAVARLDRSAITIKQLAYILGFRDAAYFNRYFARHLGQPPARFRRERRLRDAAGHAPATSFTFADWP